MNNERKIIVNKKIPERTCIACNQKQEKKNLIRIVKNKENEIFVDETLKMPGRGAYICKDIQCLEKLIKSKKLNKVFEQEIDNTLYEKIRGVFIDSSK